MRGYSLVELMIATAMIGAAVTVAGGLGATLTGADRHTNAYVEDLGGLRRAVRSLERDIRAGRGLEVYGLAEGDLRRGDRVLARNIAVFEWEQAAGFVTVRLGPGKRRDVAAPERALVVLQVRVR